MQATDHRDLPPNDTRDATMRRCCRHYGDIYRIVRSRVDDDETAADLTQDVFERAVRRVDQLEDITSVIGWLATIAVNLTRDHWRRHRFTPLGESSIDLTVVLAPAGSPEERVIADEVYASHLARFPAATQEMITLYVLQGWSVAEIAAVQHSTIAAVQRRISRTKRVLADDWNAAAE